MTTTPRIDYLLISLILPRTKRSARKIGVGERECAPGSHRNDHQGDRDDRQHDSNSPHGRHSSKLWISVQSGFRKLRRNLVDKKYLRLLDHAGLKDLLRRNQGTPDTLLIEHRPAMRDHGNGFLSQHAQRAAACSNDLQTIGLVSARRADCGCEIL